MSETFSSEIFLVMAFHRPTKDEKDSLESLGIKFDDIDPATHPHFDMTVFCRWPHLRKPLQQHRKLVRKEPNLLYGLMGEDSSNDDGPPPLVRVSDSDSDDEEMPPLVPA